MYLARQKKSLKKCSIKNLHLIVFLHGSAGGGDFYLYFLNLHKIAVEQSGVNFSLHTYLVQ